MLQSMGKQCGTEGHRWQGPANTQVASALTHTEPGGATRNGTCFGGEGTVPLFSLPALRHSSSLDMGMGGWLNTQWVCMCMWDSSLHIGECRHSQCSTHAQIHTTGKRYKQQQKLGVGAASSAMGHLLSKLCPAQKKYYKRALAASVPHCRCAQARAKAS
jgi:hypothetical protein